MDNNQNPRWERKELSLLFASMLLAIISIGDIFYMLNRLKGVSLGLYLISIVVIFMMGASIAEATFRLRHPETEAESNEIQSLIKENSRLRGENFSLKQKTNMSSEELTTINEQYAQLQSRYDSLKELYEDTKIACNLAEKRYNRLHESGFRLPEEMEQKIDDLHQSVEVITRFSHDESRSPSQVSEEDKADLLSEYAKSKKED